MDELKREIVKKLIENGSLKFGEFVLSSGKKSSYYVDVKKSLTDPDFLTLISKTMLRLAEDCRLNFDKIACIELGGVPLAVALSITSNKPYIIFRKKKKEYGVTSDLIGEINGERFVVVEDVTTTGSSALSVVERVMERGGKVLGVLVVVDREEGAEDVFKEKGIGFIPCLKASELMKYSKA
ncbi:orotate phosphoribosyltransferase [Archaeoglobus sulfaticallidus PM70-1]|uniref:Orotate phosphoribosyltransferase n=1 Tax=Archaeoglobus sulfaticallidus PM70-1 TaxID=387631 RepID=N0B9H2_9EURY|nr:orotate phosphoribosyltransferase [Archaeoglobus sulfaticallidus]AGK60254.1 orotate phosphoribosyltransferase [Archaeoglobus sulfaticallidus PM70-1]